MNELLRLRHENIMPQRRRLAHGLIREFMLQEGSMPDEDAINSFSIPNTRFRQPYFKSPGSCAKQGLPAI